MRILILSSILLSSLSFAQTRTTVMDGSFFNPLIWTPVGIPTDGDSLVIDHDVTMVDFGIPFSSGRITINSGASLSDDGAGLDIYCNGGSLINHGTIDCNDIWLDSGELENHGSITLDSMWTQGTVLNTGELTTYDLLTDQNEQWTNDGTVNVENNHNNQGVFINNGQLYVGNNFANWNTQTSDATFDCNGYLCVENDWSNANADDTVRGSGYIFVVGASSNLGIMEGTLTFNTPGGALGINTGSVAPSITFGTSVCSVGLEENESVQWTLYPNPAESQIQISLSDFDFKIMDLSGRIVQEAYSEDGLIDLAELESGIYNFVVQDKNGQISSSLFMKN